jgi:hypothetical protein
MHEIPAANVSVAETDRLGPRFRRCGVIVNMRFLVVVRFLVLLAVVVAVGQLGVVVIMRVPVGPMLVIVTEPTPVMVGDVPVIVAMRNRGMSMRRGFAFALGALHCHEPLSFHWA